MAYCRKGHDSDVYVYPTENYNTDHRRIVTTYVCHECYSTTKPSEMVSHLLQHRSKGDKVPDRVIYILGGK